MENTQELFTHPKYWEGRRDYWIRNRGWYQSAIRFFILEKDGAQALLTDQSS